MSALLTSEDLALGYFSRKLPAVTASGRTAVVEVSLDPEDFAEEDSLLVTVGITVSPDTAQGLLGGHECMALDLGQVEALRAALLSTEDGPELLARDTYDDAVIGLTVTGVRREIMACFTPPLICRPEDPRALADALGAVCVYYVDQQAPDYYAGPRF